jgi:hypothetical protein
VTDAAGRLVVFGYDFPHHKTEDLLLRLVGDGLRPQLLVGAPHVTLPHRMVRPRLRLRREPAELPRRVAGALNIAYLRAPHTASALAGVLADLRPDIGIVAGGRVLPGDVLALFPRGIVNLHPGLLPQSRGLDSWLWDIWHGRPMGVSAHVIDGHVDCGRLLDRRPIEVFADETLPEISDRLYRLQLRMASVALHLADKLDTRYASCLCDDPERGRVQSLMSAEMLAVVPERFARYPWRS